MKHMSLRSLCPLAAACAVLLFGLRISLARAEGPPTAAAIAYSGTLLKGGAPVSGSTSLGATLWLVSQGGAESEAKCTLVPTLRVLDPSGRFTLPLDPCAATIHSYPDLWLELHVNGETLAPRIKLGAVPYALEAANATRLTQSAGPRKVTVQGQYCGSTLAAGVDGSLNVAASAAGFATAKSLCEQACDGSPTAHVCLAEELVRLQQLGGGAPTTSGWIATGVAAMGSDGVQCTANDCRGFTFNGDSDSCGSVWSGTFVSTRSCSQKAPLLCCD